MTRIATTIGTIGTTIVAVIEAYDQRKESLIWNEDVIVAVVSQFSNCKISPKNNLIALFTG